MKSSKKYSFRILAVLITFCAVLAMNSCNTSRGEGFAIYLTADDIPPDQMAALSHINLSDQPIVAGNDIVTYNAGTHEIALTKNAFARIANLQVPVRGKSFVVCVDKQHVYWGAFWTPISSISFDGVTIWKPLTSDQRYTITLELGYPSSNFYGGSDPRNNPNIIKSLEQAGKLINKQSISSDQLPHSMKGYELYSWLENNEWQFTLITGTNRNKTLDEIISNTNTVSKDGWVQIHVDGIDAIKTVLSKVPQNEMVFWLGTLRSEQPSQSNVNITLPDSIITNSIKEYTEQCGLDFSIYDPATN